MKFKDVTPCISAVTSQSKGNGRGKVNRWWRNAGDEGNNPKS